MIKHSPGCIYLLVLNFSFAEQTDDDEMSITTPQTFLTPGSNYF